MPTSPSPDKRMLVGIPVSCSRFNGCNHFVPGLKTSSFQCQRTQDLPPRFDQIQGGGIGGLRDELPVRMADHEQQQAMTMMHVQVIHDRIDALFGSFDLFVHEAEEVDEMHLAAARVALRSAVSRGLPQGPRDRAFGSAPIIDFLLGALDETNVHIDRLLTPIALGGNRPHLNTI